jgi:MFS family permease
MMIDEGILGTAVYVALPLGGFVLARRVGRRTGGRLIVLAVLAVALAVALYGFSEAERLGPLQGLGWALGAILLVGFVHLGAAGLADGWLQGRIEEAWAKRGISLALIVIGYGTLILWPQVR